MIEDNISQLFITADKTVLDALKQMDRVAKKLLILVDEESTYQNLISVGDLQRAVINNVPLSAKIAELKIDAKWVCNKSDSFSYIKRVMAKIRCDFMPVVDEHKKVIAIHYWNNVFGGADRYKSKGCKAIPVVVMAGGKGTRLKPISNVLPKPLTPVGKRTILEEIIGQFQAVGCDKFHLSVNYKKELIQYFVDGFKSDDYSVDYVCESKPLGTAGSLALLRDKIDSTFFVTNCDILINQNLDEVLDYHRRNCNKITLIAALKHHKLSYGTLKTGEDGVLLALEEKPEFTFKINTGVYLLEPEVFEFLQDDEYMDITDLIEAVKSSGGQVGVFPISDKSWMDIGEWPEYIKTVHSLSDDDNFNGLIFN
ncbi:MAG: NTP transferase domain-containing protein [Flavobacteriaceae bacterium]|nr:NTP transferase domain-containing protein [Flavobacteriaceae bacterium]